MHRLGVTLTLTLTALLAAGACRRASEEPSAEEPGRGAAAPAQRGQKRVRVEVARVDPSVAALEFVFPGEVAGSRDAVLSAPLGGLVEAVLVEQGARVEKGQALVRVDSSIYAARLDQATADFEQAKADEARTLAMGQAVSTAQREGVQTRRKVSEAGLRLAQAQLGRSVIRAPFEGVIVKLEPEVGEVAPPGAPMVRVVQLAPVKVSISVADRDVTALKPGMEVRVTTDANPTVHTGKITFISQAADLKTRAFTVEVLVPNEPARLLPGMIARVRVLAEAGDEALVLPQQVLVTRATEVGVFVVDEGSTARWRTVQLGKVVGDQVVVAQGLERGERIVVTGQQDLAAGDPLEIAREGSCCSRGRVVYEKVVGVVR